MVYCGKPSRGCQNCKTRRIKCDEVRPICTQCKKSNRTCPGYPDEFDLIFRNETMAVKRRAQRAFTASNAKSSAKPKAAGSRKSPSVDKSPTTFSDANAFQITVPASANGAASQPITPPTKHEIVFAPTYDPSASYSMPPSLDTASDSSTSSGSPPSELLDEDMFLVTRSNALIPTKASSLNNKAITSTPLILDNSPVYNRYSPQFSGFESILPTHEVSFAEPLSTTPTLAPMPDLLQTEYTAIPYFFNSHVLWERHEDSQTGYLELLPKLYSRPGASVLLHAATYAVALGIMSNAMQSKPMRCEARKQYGKALQLLGSAIKDVNLATSDEIVMTIMLFVLYEQVMSDLQRKIQWASHVHGAVAFVKMRAKEQLSSPMSVHLFRAVRWQMLRAAIQQRIPLGDFPDDEGWRCDQDLGPNTANRLTLIGLPIPDLRAASHDLIQVKNQTPKDVQQLLDNIEKAQDIDRQLEAWAATLPSHWEPWISKIVTEEPTNPATSELWTGPVYCYRDLNLANIHNEYRVLRILCNGVVRDSIQALPNEAQTQQLQRHYTKAIYVGRQMCNDFSSTLPFMLGYDYYSRPGACKAQEQSTRAIGAFFAVWPAVIMRMIPHIPEMQRRWLGCRIVYICNNYGLRDAHAQKIIDQLIAAARQQQQQLLLKHQPMMFSGKQVPDGMVPPPHSPVPVAVRPMAVY